MYRYANRTKVPSNQSKNEIEKLVEKHGATGFISGTISGLAMIAFEMRDRRIKFQIPMPMLGTKGWPKNTTENKINAETRRRWRALLLVLKAKLEAVNSDIVAFDVEFLPFIVLPSGLTVSENVSPQLPDLLQGKALPPLLGAGA